MDASGGLEPCRTPCLARGLAGVVAGETSISHIDPEGYGTLVRGYPLIELGRHASFEEAAFLVLRGRLPCPEELEEFRRRLGEERRIGPGLLEALRSAPRGADPLLYAAYGLALLALYEPELVTGSADVLDATVKIAAKLPLFAVYGWYMSTGRRVVEPDPSRSHAEDLLRIIREGEPVSQLEARAFEASLVLYLDRGFNASTFTVRVVASTLSDLFSAVLAGIAALRGPLHGGALREAARALSRLETPEDAARFVEEKVMRREKVMGFGHRVYKKVDPRTVVLGEWLERLGSEKPEAARLLSIVRGMEESMRRLKGIPSNVDLYTAALYTALGIPEPLYTALFASARAVGWAAHYAEQYREAKLIRPLGLYRGPRGLRYTPIQSRACRAEG